MKKIILVYIVLCIVCSANAQAPWYQQEVRTESHDPTMIRDNRGVYTFLSTNNLLSIRQSQDGINWTNQGRIFSRVPAWIATSLGAQVEDIWAPQITFRNGLYWVYYCGSSFGTNNSVIGLVTSPTLDVTSPQYKWTDHGEVFKSVKANNYNAIDPDLIVDLQGKCWLSFGSFWSGIKMIAIDPSTGKRLASDQTVYSIASRGGSAIEGPTIIAHNGYYYLFTSWDKCCAGTSSTYRTMVGRSQKITGPYLDKQGRSLLSGFAEQELTSYGRYIGPGGGSAFNNGKRSYYVHHYYNGEENGTARIQTREIIWSDDNWPVSSQPFLGRRASFEAEHAIITNSSLLTATATTASNKEYVSLNNANSKLTFYVNALQQGNYSLRIRYASPTNATHSVTLNANAAVVLPYPSSNNSNTFPATQIVSMNVSLKSGTNVITFSKGANTVSIDRIDLIRSANMTINTNAYEDAKNISYLTPDSEGVSIAANGWMLFENVDFGSGGNNAINLLFSGNSSGDLVVSADALNGTVTQTYSVNVSNNQFNKSFATSSAISNLKGIHDVYVLFKNNTTNGILKTFSFSSVTAPTVTATATYCQNATATTLAATGTALKWYTTAIGGTSSTTAPTPITTNTGTTNYYVSQTQNGSESTRALIVVTVNPLPVISQYLQVDGGTWNQTSASIVCTSSTIVLGPQPTVNTGWSWSGPNGFSATTREITLTGITSAKAGNYSATYTDGNSCQATSAYAVTVNAAPVPTITATTPTLFCTGGSVVLTASAGTSYKWFKETTQVGMTSTLLVTEAGAYTVEVTNTAGCKEISTARQITISAPPVWYEDVDGDGIGNAAVTVTDCTKPTGYVSVAGDACPTDANKITVGNCGCGNTEASCLDCAGTPNGIAVYDNCNICVGGTTGNTACISTATINGTNAKISVIPQPFDANTTISIDNLGMIQSFTIISASGVVIETRHGLNTGKITLGEELASGLYTVIITTENDIYTTKIVKK